MEQFCPCCGNHCAQNELRCSRGREYFGGKEKTNRRPAEQEEKAIMLLRKCGHFLHHSVSHDGNAAPLLNTLTEEEKKTLEALLEKCLNSWQNESIFYR